MHYIRQKVHDNSQSKSTFPAVVMACDKRQQIKLVCKICLQLVHSKTGNPTNFYTHLKKYHRSDYTDSMIMQAQPVQTKKLAFHHTIKSKTTINYVIFCGHYAYEKHSKRNKAITYSMVLVRDPWQKTLFTNCHVTAL